MVSLSLLSWMPNCRHRILFTPICSTVAMNSILDMGCVHTRPSLRLAHAIRPANTNATFRLAKKMDSKQSEQTKMAIGAVILDLDGTLLDTEVATKGVVGEFLAKYGTELDREIEGKKRRGKTLKESAAAIIKDYDLPLTIDQFVDEIIPMYRSRWAEAKALPGATRLIKHLHKHGVPLALASNSMRDYIDAKISDQEGWKDCFSVILGSDQVKSGKPSPDIFIEAASRMCMDPERCLVIEDSMVGVEAAKAAKMKVVAVPSSGEVDCSALADCVLPSLLQFLPQHWDLPQFDDAMNDGMLIEQANDSTPYENESFPQSSQV